VSIQFLMSASGPVTRPLELECFPRAWPSLIRAAVGSTTTLYLTPTLVVSVRCSFAARGRRCLRPTRTQLRSPVRRRRHAQHQHGAESSSRT